MYKRGDSIALTKGLLIAARRLSGDGLALSVTFGDSSPKGGATGVSVRPTRDEQSLIFSETVVPCYRGQQLRDNILVKLLLISVAGHSFLRYIELPAFSGKWPGLPKPLPLGEVSLRSNDGEGKPAGGSRSGFPSYNLSVSLRSTAPLVGEPLAKPFTLRGLPKPLLQGEVARRRRDGEVVQRRACPL